MERIKLSAKTKADYVEEIKQRVAKYLERCLSKQEVEHHADGLNPSRALKKRIEKELGGEYEQWFEWKNALLDKIVKVVTDGALRAIFELSP